MAIILALGAEMVGRYAFSKFGEIYLSPEFGPVSDVDNFANFKEAVENVVALYTPDIILHDAHPQYTTTQFAQQLAKKTGAKLVLIQHHLAHVYSVANEHNIQDFAAIICDGMGYGLDGIIRGGEVFHNDEGVGHLETHPLIGGDAATKHPVRFLYGILKKFLTNYEIVRTTPVCIEHAEVWEKQIEQGFNCPETSSCGRILDAASVYLGFCTEREYEGSPAIILEKNATTPYLFTPIIKDNILLTTPLFRFLHENRSKDKHRLAATVQQYLIEGLYQIASQYNKPILWSGGCAHNKAMTDFILSKGGLTNKQISCGDAGIAYGQAAYYLRRLAYSGDDVPARQAEQTLAK